MLILKLFESISIIRIVRSYEFQNLPKYFAVRDFTFNRIKYLEFSGMDSMVQKKSISKSDIEFESELNLWIQELQKSKHLTPEEIKVLISKARKMMKLVSIATHAN